jgi:hypothetical protein
MKEGEEECPYTVKNEHLFKALVFRKNFDYPNMYKELVIACQEGDDEALVFAFEVYGRYGFDAKKYPELVPLLKDYDNQHYLNSLVSDNPAVLIAAKSIFASVILLFLNRMEISESLLSYAKLCRKWNDCFALCMSPYDISLVYSALDQGFEAARNVLISHHQERHEYIQAAHLIVGCCDPGIVYYDMKHALQHFKVQREQQAFIFGKWLSNRAETERLEAIYVPCIHIYYKTITKVKQALSCWLIICKRRIFPGYKDLVKLIGNLIWESREDTEGWKVDLERRGPNRKAKKIKI